MPISSFCWLLSYWFLLSLKDTNNEALFLHLQGTTEDSHNPTRFLTRLGQKRGEIPIFTIQSLFTCHYSSVTIHCYCSSVTVHDTVHSEFCLFKGGYPLYLKQVLLQDFLSLELLLLGSLLRKRIPYFYYYYYYLVHYKHCNFTNLVTRISSSFVTVNLF